MAEQLSRNFNLTLKTMQLNQDTRDDFTRIVDICARAAKLKLAGVNQRLVRFERAVGTTLWQPVLGIPNREPNPESFPFFAVFSRSESNMGGWMRLAQCKAGDVIDNAPTAMGLRFVRANLGALLDEIIDNDISLEACYTRLGESGAPTTPGMFSFSYGISRSQVYDHQQVDPQWVRGTLDIMGSVIGEAEKT